MNIAIDTSAPQYVPSEIGQLIITSIAAPHRIFSIASVIAIPFISLSFWEAIIIPCFITRRQIAIAAAPILNTAQIAAILGALAAAPFLRITSIRLSFLVVRMAIMVARSLFWETSASTTVRSFASVTWTHRVGAIWFHTVRFVAVRRRRTICVNRIVFDIFHFLEPIEWAELLPFLCRTWHAIWFARRHRLWTRCRYWSCRWTQRHRRRFLQKWYDKRMTIQTWFIVKNHKFLKQLAAEE